MILQKGRIFRIKFFFQKNNSLQIILFIFLNNFPQIKQIILILQKKHNITNLMQFHNKSNTTIPHQIKFQKALLIFNRYNKNINLILLPKSFINNTKPRNSINIPNITNMNIKILFKIYKCLIFIRI